MAGGSVTWGVQVEGAGALKRALSVLGETEAPFLRVALEDSGQLLEDAATRRARGGIGRGVMFTGVKGKGSGLRATVRVKHPGARSMEFGRFNYYQGYTGRSVKSGRKFQVPAGRGQKPRPFLGIVKGDAAIAEVKGPIEEKLKRAISGEWDRILAEGD